METMTLNGGQYWNEMTDADHAELLDALLEHQGIVLLSGYDCDVYNDMLYTWRKGTMQMADECGMRWIECLWIKPPRRLKPEA